MRLFQHFSDEEANQEETSEDEDEQRDASKKRTPTAPPPIISAQQLKVWQALKKYRLQKAKEEKVRAYFIFNNLTLDSLVRCHDHTRTARHEMRATHRRESVEERAPYYRILPSYPPTAAKPISLALHEPRTLKALGAIKGIGPSKVKKYGRDVIDIIKSGGVPQQKGKKRKRPASRQSAPKSNTASKPAIKKSSKEHASAVVRDDKMWDVQDILDHRKVSGRWEYLVSWKGFDSSRNSWEPRKNLSSSLLKEYEQSCEPERKEAKGTTKRRKQPVMEEKEEVEEEEEREEERDGRRHREPSLPAASSSATSPRPACQRKGCTCTSSKKSRQLTGERARTTLNTHMACVACGAASTALLRSLFNTAQEQPCPSCGTTDINCEECQHANPFFVPGQACELCHGELELGPRTYEMLEEKHSRQRRELAERQEGERARLVAWHAKQYPEEKVPNGADGNTATGAQQALVGHNMGVVVAVSQHLGQGKASAGATCSRDLPGEVTVRSEETAQTDKQGAQQLESGPAGPPSAVASAEQPGARYPQLHRTSAAPALEQAAPCEQDELTKQTWQQPDHATPIRQLDSFLFHPKS
eukprot:g47167.t1